MFPNHRLRLFSKQDLTLGGTRYEAGVRPLGARGARAARGRGRRPRSGKSSERHSGQTTQKANTYLGAFWTSQPEQVLTFSLVTSI